MAEPFRFLVDESALPPAALGGPDELGEAFERLVGLIQGVRAHSTGKFSLIWELPLGQHLLLEWLFDSALGIDREIASALQIALHRTPDWDDGWDMTGIPTEASFDGLRQEAFSVCAAAHGVQRGSAIACLSALPARGGRLAVDIGGCTVELFFITHSSDVVAFFRDLPEVEDLDENAYFDNACFAFPALRFVREHTHFRDFAERYQTIRSKVTTHLAVLNDHAREILGRGESVSAKEARFGSLGVNASGENANTKGNHAAMRQREVTMDGRTIGCDWHTKLRPHVDRIYFNATSTDFVVIGVFREHLD